MNRVIRTISTNDTIVTIGVLVGFVVTAVTAVDAAACGCACACGCEVAVTIGPLWSFRCPFDSS